MGPFSFSSRASLLRLLSSPIDVISHLPVMCEDGALPYVFVQSKVCGVARTKY